MSSFKPVPEVSKCISVTALVDIQTERASQTGRVFFEISMIAKERAQELHAKLVPCPKKISGVGPTPFTSQYKTAVQQESLHDPEETPVTVCCHVVDKLSPVNCNLSIEIHRKLMKEHQLEPIADTFPSDQAAVDILLSLADSYAYRKGPDLPFPEVAVVSSSPSLVGQLVDLHSRKEKTQARLVIAASDEALDKALENMWTFTSTPE